MDPIVAHSRAMIREGSQSFAGAARLLGPGVRDSVYLLYAWCRHCDDRIDEQDLGRGAPARADASARGRLAALERDTLRALAGEHVEHPVFVGLERVVRRHGIPPSHPLDLLRGFAMDVERRDYGTLEELSEYCYHVAGVVGVMMARVMGARGGDALDRASDLGIALQMTNIARDVIDDASAGRVYLPREWLDRAGVPPKEVACPSRRAALAGVVRRLLDEAERYYRSGSRGLAALPFRSAWAVAVARGVYRDIGGVVRRRGTRAWDERCFVGKPRKLFRVFDGAARALAAVFVGRRRRLEERSDLWTRPRESR